ncbi:435_t:CDS:1 [Scutellospora calospora]|uniref:435_t:CDS:1 n=1 Tax=Scutellospora calospora TaxID=85575 RepID=A0ACA9NF74_9GLOM|nr:435_t:CDS:1 [Scutellospora calospora]
MNSLQFQLLTESLDSVITELEPEIDIDIDPCYDDNFVKSIILHYLNNPSRSINVRIKSDHWYSNILFNYDELWFRQTLRMKPSTFWMIVNKIQNHEIFKNIPQRKQNSIEKQLAVVLYRLGGKATIWDICSKFGIAEGTVPLFTTRVIKVLKSLKEDVIIWPHSDYRQKVHKGFEKMHSFSNIIGALDGSHMNLFEASSKFNKDVYFTWKHRYAIHLQAVVDHQGIFINYDIRYLASVHDAKVFQNSSLYCCRNQLFEETNYVLADSAYPISLNIIPSFKNPLSLDKNQQIAFNKKYSKSRVIVEQIFGQLKNRFQLLKELRTKNTKTATDLIEILLILYNILERNNDKCKKPSEQILIYRIQLMMLVIYEVIRKLKKRKILKGKI